MRTGLRLVSLAIAFLTVVLWFFSGPNFGATKTTVIVTMIDPATHQASRIRQRRFLLGVDFLGAGLGAALVVFGLSWLAPLRGCDAKPPAKTPNPER